MSAAIRCLVRRDTYRDSVELMRVAAELEALPGCARAALMMGTPANLALLAEAGLLDGGCGGGGPRRSRRRRLRRRRRERGASPRTRRRAPRRAARRRACRRGGRTAPRTIAEAVADRPAPISPSISTPGAYATAEALKALKRGLYVFLFSDNVSIEEEIELKRLAVGKGLLVMGPDCGTAILDGVPLGFANAVRRGRIGLVGASGTGLQQVSCLIDRLGEGVSQVIGVGGHDLDERVGGLMMLRRHRASRRRPGTAVIVLVSKPPAPAVARRVLDAARQSGKPVVACFLGGDPAPIAAAAPSRPPRSRTPRSLAVALARGEPAAGAATAATRPRARGAPRAAGRLARPAPRARSLQRRHALRGGRAASSARRCGAARRGHTVVDLGADEFTVGRPHPMIDFRLRNERIAEPPPRIRPPR